MYACICVSVRVCVYAYGQGRAGWKKVWTNMGSAVLGCDPCRVVCLLYAISQNMQHAALNACRCSEYTAHACKYLHTACGLQNFKSIDVATTLYALGRMQLPMSRDLMRLLLDKLDAHMFSFQPSQLANAGWALARLQLQLRQLRQWQHAVQQAEGQQLQPLRHELHPAHCNGTPTTLQQLPQAGDEPQPPAARRHTHAADACSRQQLEFPFPTSVLRRFLSACYISLDRFTSLDLSMTCWALATLRVAPPQSFLTVFLRRVEQVGGWGVLKIMLVLYAWHPCRRGWCDRLRGFQAWLAAVAKTSDLCCLCNHALR